MTKSRDTVTIVEKLRPVTTVDDQWPASARDAALERLLIVATDTPPEPPRRSGRRRVLITAAVTAGLVTSGAGIAAAGGLLPDSFTGPLSFWVTETDGAVDAQTARRVAQTPGPDGRVLSVWSGKAKDGTTCIAPLFEPPGDLDRPAPRDFELAGGQCGHTDPRTESFGNGGGSADRRGIHMMWVTSGKAVRAELRLPDGTVRPALPAEGFFFFWYLANENVDPPVLVGYDANGNLIAETPLPNLITRVRTRIGG
jgi:hypothetical protein